MAAHISQIRDYIAHWNTTAQPFEWTATAEEILAKVRLVQTNIKKLVPDANIVCEHLGYSPPQRALELSSATLIDLP